MNKRLFAAVNVLPYAVVCLALAACSSSSPPASADASPTAGDSSMAQSDGLSQGPDSSQETSQQLPDAAAIVDVGEDHRDASVTNQLDGNADVSTPGISPSNFSLADISDILANPVLIDIGTGGTCTLSTDDGSFTCTNFPSMQVPKSKVVTLSGGTMARVWVMDGPIITEPVTIRGSLPAIWYAIQGAELYGPITVTAGGQATGAGIGGGTSSDTSGGGGGSFCGVGGAGASLGSGNPSMAGATYGSDNLIPLVGGSQGGGTQGGAGGGALQITGTDSITVNFMGAVIANGAPGGATNGKVGSGGGSGGSILLEGPTVEIQAGGVVSASGGAGGDASHAGNDGGGTGGLGSSSTNVNGAPGMSPGGGGGGGGAGRIRINTTSGMPTIAGTVSPDMTTSCVKFGTLM